jgi:hypothetical protein
MFRRIIDARCAYGDLGNARVHRVRYGAEFYPTGCERECAGIVYLLSGRGHGVKGWSANTFSSVHAD